MSLPAVPIEFTTSDGFATKTFANLCSGYEQPEAMQLLVKLRTNDPTLANLIYWCIMAGSSVAQLTGNIPKFEPRCFLIGALWVYLVLQEADKLKTPTT